MERKLKNFWMIASLMMVTSAAYADNWDSLIRKISNRPKTLSLTSSLEQSPQFRITPKVVAFRGVVKLPSDVYLINGSAKVQNAAAQLIIDDQITCNFSPRHYKSRDFDLVSCSDGSRAGDEMIINDKIVLRLNAAGSSKASIYARLSVLRQDSISYGLQFPFLNPDEGDVLMFNGTAWVPTDPTEIAGLRGEPGAQGEQGEMGPMGPQGPQGPKGEKGDVGPAGAQGPAGAPGPKGATGEPGLNGLKGDMGPQGPAGPAGVAGPQGPQGPVGPMGPQGPKGDAGLNGAAGAQGPVGPMGPQGPAGPMGPHGPKGDAGLNGTAGAQGPVGPQGPTGPAGAQGAKGDMGPQGLPGPMGLPGAAGAQGPKGDQGEVGPMGPQGLQGPKGDKGEKGDRGLSELAYLREERDNGVSAGTCTQGIWQGRSLNVLGGNSTFITLANNRFSLVPGKYFIEISVPAYAVNLSQAKLVVVQTGADALIGSVANSFSNGPSVSLSIIQGELIVSETSSFEIQQRCQTTRTSNGLGVASGFGTKEIYTQVKIIKTE